MNVGHQQTVITNTSSRILATGTVNSTELMDFGTITNLHKAALPLKFKVLWLLANGGTLENMAILPDLGPARNNNVRAYLCTVTNLYIFTNNRKWPDFNIFSQLCIGMNHGKLMYISNRIIIICHKKLHSFSMPTGPKTVQTYCYSV